VPKAIRLALLTEIPAPYRMPLFRELAARKDVDPLVLFLAERDPRRNYLVYRDELTFPHQILPGRGFVAGGRWVVASRGVGAALRRFDPHAVVVGGWNQPAFWQALVYARRRGIPRIGWVESTARDARPGAPPLELLKRRMARACTGFLVPGAASREYLEALGVPAERIAVAPNAVDTAIFGERVAEARTRRDELRRELGLARPTVLFVGRLEPEKDVATLLAAMDGLDADLVVVGSGSERTSLEQAAPAGARFLGWLERDELPRWYAAADAFALPSRSEPWSLPLNEAAAAGLPLVATEAAGAAWSLVDDGVNGFRVPVGDPAALRSALDRALQPAFAEGARARSLALAAEHTPQRWAAAVAAFARATIH
jgi:glycosyltransferase involved in cell wall biosynthesis